MTSDVRPIQVRTTAADLPGPAWDALLADGDVHLSTRGLRVVEHAAAVPMRYLLAYRDSVLTAGLATAELDHTAPWLLGRPDTLLAHSIRLGMPGGAEFGDRLHAGNGAPVDVLPGLVCGGRHLGRTRVLGANPGCHEEVERLVIEAEQLAARRRLRSVSFLYVDESEIVLRELLERRGYWSFESEQYSWLPLAPGGFPSYLAAFTAHRRQRIVADRRRIARAGLRMSVQPLTADLLPRLSELDVQLLRKYGFDSWGAELSSRFLHAVMDAFGRDAIVTLATDHADGTPTIRGFGLLLRLGRAWLAARAGFDYPFQTAHKLPLYSEVLFYTPVEHADAAGVTTIHYGVGSGEAKRLRGCRSSRQFCYLRPCG